MRIAAHWVVVAVVSVLLFPAAAFADTCHVGPPLEALGLGLHLSMSLESAAYNNARGAGNYLGAALAVAYRREWLRARVELPAYRLRRNSETFYGPGDILVGTDLALVRDDKDTFQGGASLAVTVPTGDEAEDLGMGHFMLMPGVWGELVSDRTFVQMQIVYGRSLGSHDEQAADEHAGHHGHVQNAQHATGPGPIVNPMNTSEIAGRLGAGYRLVGPLRIRAGVDAALPVADEQGEARGIAVLGLDLLPDPFNMTFEGQVPFVGDPFTLKAEASAGFRF